MLVIFSLSKMYAQTINSRSIFTYINSIPVGVNKYQIYIAVRFYNLVRNNVYSVQGDWSQLSLYY